MLVALLVLAMDPRAALDAGDEAWRAGERPEAREAWRAAAEAEDPAIRAMAETRLLRVSGNIGWMVHGPRADRALSICEWTDPWCDLARADLDLTLRDLGLSDDAGQAGLYAQRAAEALPEAAALRQRWLEAPAEVFPPGPGTWSLGLSALAGPGLGVGGAARLVHPDLGGRGARLDASLLGTSRGIAALSLGWQSPGHPPGGRASWMTLGSAGLSRGAIDLYSGDERSSLLVTTASIFAGPGLRRGPLSLWAGPQLRRDVVAAEVLGGHGARAGARLARGDGRLSARASGELALDDYPLGRLGLDLRGLQPTGRLAVAARLLGETTPWLDDTTPTWRLPSAGGSDLLRGAPFGRYRGPTLLAGAVELRATLSPSWGLVAFGELAWVPVPEDTHAHPGAGLGLRLNLPPRPNNLLRLDLGFTDAGWGLVAGWGEAF